MITEVIKRGHRKGYDENGNLVYKIPVDEASPVVEEAQEEIQEEVEEEVQQDEEVSPTFPFTIGK